jgi:hypothetical protein
MSAHHLYIPGVESHVRKRATCSHDGCWPTGPLPDGVDGREITVTDGSGTHTENLLYAYERPCGRVVVVVDREPFYYAGLHMGPADTGTMYLLWDETHALHMGDVREDLHRDMLALEPGGVLALAESGRPLRRLTSDEAAALRDHVDADVEWRNHLVYDKPYVQSGCECCDPAM